MTIRTYTIRELTTEPTPERKKRAQELLSNYLSIERVASDLGISSGTIRKWIKLGFITKFKNTWFNERPSKDNRNKKT